MSNQPGKGGAALQGGQEEDKRKRRWTALLLLLLLLLVPLCLWIVSQLAFVALGMNEVDESLLSQLQATYAPWPEGRFGALDPTLIGTIRAEQATFAANIGGPGSAIIIPFVPGSGYGLTQIADIPDNTPSPTARLVATASATPLATATPIVIYYPDTPTAAGVPPPTVVVPTSIPTAALPPPKPSLTPVPNTVDLSITKSDGVLVYTPGGPLTYTIVVRNNGPFAVVNAPVTDIMPAQLTAVTWTCAATSGSSCATGSGIGDINTTVNLLKFGRATFTVNATVSIGATGNLVNTASVAPPAGITDINPTNNSAPDADGFVDLAITNTDGKNTILRGHSLTYTIVVSNPGAVVVAGAAVSDPLPTGPTQLGGPFTWTCSGTAGTSFTCPTAGTSTLADTVTVPGGGSITYNVTATLNPAAVPGGTVTNTATVAAAGDVNPANNSVADTDTITDVTVSLEWESNDPISTNDARADFDLWVVDPSGGWRIIHSANYGYSQNYSSSGGTLGGIDWTCPSGDPNPVPNVPYPWVEEKATWTSTNVSAPFPPSGRYHVNAYFNQNCQVPAGETISWRITVTVDGVPTLIGPFTVSNQTITRPPNCPGLLLLPGAGPVTPTCSAPLGAYDPSADPIGVYTYSFSVP